MKEKKINVFYLIISALIDLISSFLVTFGMDFLPASINKMFSGLSLIITFILSIFFLKIKIPKKFYRSIYYFYRIYHISNNSIF